MIRRAFLKLLAIAPFVKAPALLSTPYNVGALPATNVIGAGTDLTLAKLLEAKRILDEQNVPREERYIADFWSHP